MTTVMKVVNANTSTLSVINLRQKWMLESAKMRKWYDTQSTTVLVMLLTSIVLVSPHPNNNRRDQDSDDEKFDMKTSTIKTKDNDDDDNKTTKEISSLKEHKIQTDAEFSTGNVRFVSGNGKIAKGREKLNDEPEQKEIDAAAEYGLKRMRELYFVKEPELYRMGLFLNRDHPGYLLASFRNPSEKAARLARYGYAALEARTKLAETYHHEGRESSSSPTPTLRSAVLLDECPLQGFPRCPSHFERYRTMDGTCNNIQNPWRGASMQPMQRFLPPSYNDGIQSIRRSVTGTRLPSPREISVRIHRDKNREMPTVTLMFMQWGQFLDHDIVSSVQARTFNRSVPRCCDKGGRDLLPPEFTHPECLPISVPEDDWFFGQFGIRCLEFVRSAPTSRIDCDLGWREQITQVTSYIDASTVYGSDPEMSESLRLFRKGQLLYGRPRDQGPLQPPDPPGGELCRLGAVTTDCFRGGDLRVGDQPGLTALHTVWLRYHNRIAMRLLKLNPHWTDEKIFQEARRIVGALVQHVTYKEFLPILLGQEVMKLFELNLKRTGYYDGYNPKVNSAPANAFGTAAFRFGHSLVQNSFVRTDAHHRMIPNNVSLHQEQENVENIWSFGSVDRLLLGLSSQPSQRRDEFISDELTNHLFQPSDLPFGMDLAAVNIQRGRDHGLPSYTSWREPCGLIPLKNWTDLKKIMNPETIRRFRSLYAHVDDIDLFSGGLAEKPVRGGIVGPTFACIMAQQFSNLQKGDRFWYENGNFRSSFTPAQLQQIRRVTFAHVLCMTTSEIETLQPFVFLSADDVRNIRISCQDLLKKGLDLNAWEEKVEENFHDFAKRSNDDDDDDDDDSGIEVDLEDHDDVEVRKRNKKRRKPSRRRTTTTSKPKTKPLTANLQQAPNHVAYKPFKVKLTGINTSPITSSHKKKNRRPTTYNVQNNKPLQVYDRPTTNNHNGRPTYVYQRPNIDKYLVNYSTQTSRPSNPYNVNINIQFLTGQGQTFTNDDRYNNYGGYYATTTRRTIPYDYHRPSYDRPADDYDDHYRPTHRPTFDQETVFEDRPFATSNQPYGGYYINRNPTTRPVIIPSYLYLNNQQEQQDIDYQPFRPNRRPINNPYKTDDEDGEAENDEADMEATDAFFNSQYKKYSNGTYSDDQDTKYVKISSVQGHRVPTAEEMKNPVYISAVQQKEGDLELPLDNETVEDPTRVQIDVVPSEIESSHWKIYNETKEDDNFLSIFDVIRVNGNVSCSPELPRPMKLLETNATA